MFKRRGIGTQSYVDLSQELPRLLEDLEDGKLDEAAQLLAGKEQFTNVHTRAEFQLARCYIAAIAVDKERRAKFELMSKPYVYAPSARAVGLAYWIFKDSNLDLRERVAWDIEHSTQPATLDIYENWPTYKTSEELHEYVSSYLEEQRITKGVEDAAHSITVTWLSATKKSNRMDWLRTFLSPATVDSFGEVDAKFHDFTMRHFSIIIWPRIIAERLTYTNDDGTVKPNCPEYLETIDKAVTRYKGVAFLN